LEEVEDAVGGRVECAVVAVKVVENYVVFASAVVVVEEVRRWVGRDAAGEPRRAVGVGVGVGVVEDWECGVGD
jgi:hypothetical protein